MLMRFDAFCFACATTDTNTLHFNMKVSTVIIHKHSSATLIANLMRLYTKKLFSSYLMMQYMETALIQITWICLKIFPEF